jgi:intron-binding protein aquarius
MDLFPLLGFPARVTTVDKFQGQQNDYILLSLVRTESVGHLRDVRRLVVALSRARLGLYIFCRQSLFQNCYELNAAFSQLSSRPNQLQLVVGEGFPTHRSCISDVQLPIHAVADVTEMGILVYQMVQQAQQLSREIAYSAETVISSDLVLDDSNSIANGGTVEDRINAPINADQSDSD